MKNLTFSEVKPGEKFEIIKGSGYLCLLVDQKTDNLFKTIRRGTIITISSVESVKNYRYGSKKKFVYFDLNGDLCKAKWGEFKKLTRYMGT